MLKDSYFVEFLRERGGNPTRDIYYNYGSISGCFSRFAENRSDYNAVICANDVVALAQTGTGKTAAFGLPLIQKTDIKQRVPQALILCPTRELCLQIAGDLNDYSKYIDGLKVLPVYGGSSIESQIRMLKTGVHIIVATPGRLIDVIRGAL